MTITATQTYGDAIPRISGGSFLDDAAGPAPYTVKLGYAPKHVRVVNLTAGIEFEWFQGMDAGDALRRDAAGAGAAVGADAITVDANETTITFGTAIVAQNAQFYWIAE